MKVCGICLILIGLLSACEATENTSPFFAWGSREFFKPLEGRTRRAAYQAMSSSVSESVLSAALQPGSLDGAAAELFAAASTRPDVTVLFLGGQVASGSLRELADGGTLEPLQAALDAAPASVSVPYMQHQGVTSLRESLLAIVKASGSSLQLLGSCDGAASVTPLKDAPLPAAGAYKDAPAVFVVCPGEADSLADEMALLGKLSSAVAAAGGRHLILYAPDQGGAAGGASRSLLAHKGDAPPPPPPGTRVCDERCRTQVNQLEAGILLFTLLIALGLGTYCMGILGTPSVFESVKDER